MSLTRVELDPVLDVPSVYPVPRDAGPAAALCRCGHDGAAHEHYRAGSDCGACGAAFCGRFRPTGPKGLLRRWLRRR